MRSVQTLDAASPSGHLPAPEARRSAVREGITYVLPLRREALPSHDELPAYLASLLPFVDEVVVVDGSPSDVFAAHARTFPAAVRHLPVDPSQKCRNGKVAGVRTALRAAHGERVVIADDDVRYDRDTLARVVAGLDDADVVRPQNVFVPMPWHAYLDSGRSLIARATGGDWPGTLAIRRSSYLRVGGYDGDVLFENLELVRTLRAVGGYERRLDDTFVVRRPPSAAHYLRQRVRQAYDEFARPARLGTQLAFAPLALIAARIAGSRGVAVLALIAIATAEAGRRRSGGTTAFPLLASLLAPCWIFERSFTSWLAVLARLRGGVRYGNARVLRAATPARRLRRLLGTIA